ncbi:ABC transporter permease [Actinoallomurus oryzae]|jgi:NitT/TauT family transport system permease protein
MSSSRTRTTATGERRKPAGGRRRTEALIFGTLGVGVFLISWQLVSVSGAVDAILLPAPTAVASAFGDMFTSPGIGADLRASGVEFIIGFLLSLVIGLPLGMLIGWYKRLGFALEPLINFFYSTPRIALMPILIIWFGIGLSSKIAVVFLGGVFPILINAAAGVRTVDRTLIQAARVFNATDRQVFLTVNLPACVPFVLSGMRLAVGQGLIGVFVGELLGAQHGVGLLVANAGASFQTPRVLAGVALIAAAGVVLTNLLGLAERHFSSWRAQ